ncbi:Orexigenic neuropeptide QRFP [Mesitornis unicolor]|uniref:Orexigenic neuropeptide QRFP n=1 Tax=Mesitornis unicolor TaxID=54374 RepID=A0A091R7D5_9AVES|nr:PREDICTED: orexigenic neuropeptide QRFP [Mesitornis unicolor]KFQ35361.1 Orexigenic neuropeptide QRFP [Mesitornis unicolor]
MRAPYSLSCLFLLSLGSCFPLQEHQELGDPRDGTPIKPHWQAVAEDLGAKQRQSQELSTLLGIAWRLRPRGYGQGGSGQRQGRQGGSELLPAGGEERSGTLGSLAEGVSGYNRKKGGFTFRFGR